MTDLEEGADKLPTRNEEDVKERVVLGWMPCGEVPVRVTVGTRAFLRVDLNAVQVRFDIKLRERDDVHIRAEHILVEFAI